MITQILAMKLHPPPFRSKIVLRPHLIDQLNEGFRQDHGFGRKLTLISAPAGFGKSTLVREWAVGLEREAPGGRADAKFAWPGCRWTKGITTPSAF